MKRFAVYGVILLLLLSLGTVFVSAMLPDEFSWEKGYYMGGDPEAYEPVGTLTVTWDSDFASKVDLTDGKLSDWYATELPRANINLDNMVGWVGDSSAVTDWKITSFAAADSDYLYLAFEVVDENFAYGNKGGHYDGDAILLAMDFGNMMGRTLQEDPDILPNPKNAFYSFSCTGDGAPLEIMRQESDVDGFITTEEDAKGAATKTDNGWSAELALSWQMLYDDYIWKAWVEDPHIYVSEEFSLPLQIGACLYYLNRTETAGEITWAAGTLQNRTDDDGVPCVSWSPYDNGIMWELPIQGNVKFNCNRIINIFPFETITETEPPTEPPYDPPMEDITELASEAPTLPPVWDDTVSPEVEETLRDAAESLDKEDELNDILEKYGCSSVVGMGMPILLLMAAATLLRRKKRL